MDRPLTETCGGDVLKPSIFRRRQVIRARSEKPSTVATRLRETRRTGLSAAMRKINLRWRVRLCRKRQEFESSEIYQTMAAASATWCEQELKKIEDSYRLGRDMEIRALRHAVDNGLLVVQEEGRAEASTNRLRELRPDTYLFNQRG